MKSNELQAVCKMIEGSRAYYIGIVMGILVGALFAISGFILAILGFSGSIELLIEASNFNAKIINAGPGVIFALMGMIIIWRYKPKGKLEIIVNEDKNGSEFHCALDQSMISKERAK